MSSIRNRKCLATGMTFGCVVLSATCIVERVTAAEPPLQTIVFQTSSGKVLNPERGFFRFRDLTNSSGYNQVRGSGQSLIYGRILANNFRTGPLSQSFLNSIQAGFDAARANGIKVKPRVAIQQRWRCRCTEICDTRPYPAAQAFVGSQ